MNSRAIIKDPVQFSETVQQYMHEYGLDHVVLRVYSAKKRGRGYVKGDGWIGEVRWSPIAVNEDSQAPHSFHVGTFLSEDEQAISRLPKLTLGRHYTIAAYHPDTHENISTVVCQVGDEDEETSTAGGLVGLGDLRAKINEFKKIKETLKELDDGFEDVSQAVSGPKRRPAPSYHDSIEIEDGLYVNSQTLAARYEQQRKRNDELQEQLEELREMVSSDKNPGKQSDSSGWIGQLMNGFLSGLVGAGGGGGLPNLGELMSGNGLAGILRGMSGQTVSGPQAGFDQSNPFSSLLAGVDLNSINTNQQPQPQPTYQSPIQQAQAQPQAQPQNYGDEPVMPVVPPNVGGKKKRRQQQAPTEYEEREDVELMQENSAEMSQLSRELFNKVFPAFGSGGEEGARETAKREFLPLCKQVGLRISEVQLMALDPETFATMLLQSLPTMTKTMIKPFQAQVKPILVDTIKEIEWNSVEDEVE